MKTHSLNATTLRLVLFIALFAIAVIAGVIVNYLIEDQLKPYAINVSHTVVDANASQNNVEKLQQIQKELAANQDAIDRASSIVADSQSYQYQDQIITDINDYANKAGISITNIDFSAASSTSSTTSTGGGTTPAPATSAAPVASAPAGVKSTPIAVTVKNPVDYDSLLRFIKSIEDNLTKMQISKVGLAKGTDGTISSEVLTIEVYIK